jgi:hypothetical protein
MPWFDRVKREYAEWKRVQAAVSRSPASMKRKFLISFRHSPLNPFDSTIHRWIRQKVNISSRQQLRAWNLRR